MEDPPPPEPSRGVPPAQVQVWAGMLGGLVQAYCRDAEIASRFVASRADLEAVAEWWYEGERASEPPLAVLQGWRREMVGNAILEWLSGGIAIVADGEAPLGIRLVEAPDGVPER
jgi:ribonuclease D